MTQMLTPVLPKTLRLTGGPVPFLRFFKSTDERKKLGILDRQCAVFVLPTGSAPADLAKESLQSLASAANAESAISAKAPDASLGAGFDGNHWELRWGDNGDDHQCPAEWLEVAELLSGSDVSKIGDQVSWLLQEYRRHVQACPPNIRLPFVLEYREVPKVTSEALDWLDCPKQLFSLELTFSSSENFVPIEPIRIPFIAQEGGASAGRQLGGFPCMNKLLLKLQPISPVPTSFGVNIAFNDCHGHMYFGQLETFTAAFQDLFLPVRLPLVFWSHLFESLWQGSLEEACWSVKVLDLDREVMQELIRSQLGPFVVPAEVNLPEEDFDFEQEEYFERWNALPLAEGDGTGAAPVDEEEEEVVLNVETVCIIVFIPPSYHLLMRFAISSHSTIVRVLTDRFQLLSYMDAFFMSWSRDAAALSDLGTAGKCSTSAV